MLAAHADRGQSTCHDQRNDAAATDSPALCGFRRVNVCEFHGGIVIIPSSVVNPKMSEPVKHTAKLWERKQENGSYWLFWCPACKRGHGIPTPQWGFDGKVESPTFTPSLRLSVTRTETGQTSTVCHLNVTDGKIVYHGDCPHELAGQTILMEPLPENYGF